DLDGLGRVIASGYLKRVESLSLIAGTRYAAEELPRMARALAASPDVAGLRRLALHYAITAYTDTDEIVTELAAGRHWHSLTAFELDMRGRLSAGPLQALARAPLLARLEELSLSEGGAYALDLGAGAVAAIAKGFPALRSLQLSGGSLDDVGAE